MDLASKIIILLSTLLFIVIGLLFYTLGLNDLSVFINTLLLSIGGYLLFFANTPLKANRYRKLKTPWSERARHNEYPRPQLTRAHWINLNGQWDYAILPRHASMPRQFTGSIKVPFPLESDLSGVAGKIRPNQKLWYKTVFQISEQRTPKLRLHFGGVDWECEVWINKHCVGIHRGGHDAFYFDIEKFLQPGKSQTLHVSVWDPCDRGVQPRGKQSIRPSNIYYKSVTGIWQTVWLEPLPETFLENLTYHSDIYNKTLELELQTCNLQDGDRFQLQVFDGETEIAQQFTEKSCQTITLPTDSELWSPENPKLYPAVISILRDNKVIDSANTYFALRKIEIRKEKNNINRVVLNGKPIFQLGLLDQGWWPDGLYTAPSDAALQYDIKVSKAMGFNMIRKHVKVEPARWYYYCDKYGMLVWQDMPTGDKNILPRQKDIQRSAASKQIFHQELEAMINQLRFFQSIVCWGPFNEGWGQFETNAVLEKVKAMDVSRLVDGPSGWNDRGVGDFRDHHIYMRKLYVGSQKPNRCEAIGEFGGIGHRIAANMAVSNSWSYNNVNNRELLKLRYRQLYEEQLIPLIEQGLCAAVYTQTTDVESEINGLLTYDRKVEKIPVAELNIIHQHVYQQFQKTV